MKLDGKTWLMAGLSLAGIVVAVMGRNSQAAQAPVIVPPPLPVPAYPAVASFPPVDINATPTYITLNRVPPDVSADDTEQSAPEGGSPQCSCDKGCSGNAVVGSIPAAPARQRRFWLNNLERVNG